MARRYSGPRGRVRGRSGNRGRWTAVVDSYTLAGGSVDETIVIAPADYRTATSLENEATFLRLRGSIQIANTSATLSCTVVVAIMKLAEGFAGATFDPANQANLQNGDILWAQSYGLQPLAAASQLSSMHIGNIDVKSKRRLGSVSEGDKITMVVSNVVGGGTISVVAMARALMLLKL